MSEIGRISYAEGAKVADVAWAGNEFMNEQYKTPYPLAPVICVEILSPGNTG